MLKDFKDFAFKGNVMDMAVGIIIGGAFGTVVKSLVDNIFMPTLGSLTGKVNFTEKFIALDGGDYATYQAALDAGVPVIGWGQFATDFISFLLLAFAVYLVIKKFMGVFKKEEEAATAPPKPSTEEILLAEIRDELKKQNG